MISQALKFFSFKHLVPLLITVSVIFGGMMTSHLSKHTLITILRDGQLNQKPILGIEPFAGIVSISENWYRSFSYSQQSPDQWVKVDREKPAFWQISDSATTVNENKANPSIWFKIELPPWEGQNLSLLLCDMDSVEVAYLNGNQIYNKNDLQQVEIKNWKLFSLSTNSETKSELILKYPLKRKYISINVDTGIIVGDATLIMQFLFFRDFVTFILAMFYCVIGIIIFTSYSRTKESKASHFSFSSLAFLFGVYNFFTTQVFLMWFGDFFIWKWYSEFAWVIPFMFFIQYTFEARNRSIIGIMKWYHIILFVLCIPVMAYPIRFIELLLFLKHIGLLLDIAVVFVYAIPNIYKGEKSVKIISLGLLFFAISGFLSLALEVETYHWCLMFLILSLMFHLERQFNTYKEDIQNYAVVLTKKNKALLKLDHLKDEFLTTTTHELKTPLHGIIGIAESILARNENEISKDTSLSFQRIVSSARRLSNLINDILDVARLKINEIQIVTQSVDISVAVNQTLESLIPLINTDFLTINNTIPANRYFVMADDNRLQQILQNLIGNAIKYSEEGSIDILAEHQERHVIIRVSDQGIGIPADKLDDVFNAFSRVEQSGNRKISGTGIGLSITKKLVELHQGELTVSSIPQKGSIFSFTLPVAEQSARLLPENQRMTNSTAQLKEETLDISSNQFKSKNPFEIVIIDDEALNITIIETILKDTTYKISGFTSAKIMLDYIQENQPDLVLLDINMPLMDGFEVCARIRQKYPPDIIPILFLSARNSEKDIQKGFRVGGNDYITKPFSTGELLSRINLHLKTGHERNREIVLNRYINKLNGLNNTELIIEETFNALCEEKELLNVIVFDEEQIIHCLDSTQYLSSYAEAASYKDSEVSLTSHINKNKISIQILELKSYLFWIYSEKPFSSSDIGFIRSIFNQIRVVRRHLFEMINNSEISKKLYEIAANLDQILFIKSSDKYCSIYSSKKKGIPTLLRVTIKTIQLYFQEKSLLQVHRSYIVNPNKVTEIRKKSAKYEIRINNEIIPISEPHLANVKKMFPTYFS